MKNAADIPESERDYKTFRSIPEVENWIKNTVFKHGFYFQFPKDKRAQHGLNLCIEKIRHDVEKNYLIRTHVEDITDTLSLYTFVKSEYTREEERILKKSNRKPSY